MLIDTRPTASVTFKKKLMNQLIYVQSTNVYDFYKE